MALRDCVPFCNTIFVRMMVGIDGKVSSDHHIIAIIPLCCIGTTSSRRYLFTVGGSLHPRRIKRPRYEPS